MTDTTETGNTTPAPDRIECRATKDPVIRLFIMAAMLIGFGVWCWVDRETTKQVPFSMEEINAWSKWALAIYGPWLFVPPGLLIIALGIVALAKRFVVDAEGLGYVGKEKIAWSSITAVDATLLGPKGLLFVHHGQGQVLKLCDWKLTDFKPMVAFLEQHLPAGVTAKMK